MVAIGLDAQWERAFLQLYYHRELGLAIVAEKCRATIVIGTADCTSRLGHHYCLIALSSEPAILHHWTP